MNAVTYTLEAMTLIIMGTLLITGLARGFTDWWVQR